MYAFPMKRRAKPGNPTHAIAYLRVSTDRQELGPQAQRKTIESWALKEQKHILSWYVEQLSGSTEINDRPKLIEAIVALQVHKAGVLVVAKRDRLARDVAIAATIDRTVRQAGARVISADGVGNGEEPAEAFLRTILDGAAAYERALIRQRTKAALAVKIAKGERVGGRVRYGFLETIDGKLIPNPQEQQTINRVIELHNTGLSLRKIVVQLHDEGFLSRARKPFLLNQVRVMLSRHTYNH